MRVSFLELRRVARLVARGMLVVAEAGSTCRPLCVYPTPTASLEALPPASSSFAPHTEQTPGTNPGCGGQRGVVAPSPPCFISLMAAGTDPPGDRWSGFGKVGVGIRQRPGLLLRGVGVRMPK